MPKPRGLPHGPSLLLAAFVVDPDLFSTWVAEAAAWRQCATRWPLP